MTPIIIIRRISGMWLCEVTLAHQLSSQLLNTSWWLCYLFFKISETVILLTFKVSVTTCNLNVTLNGPNIVIAQICIDTMIELPTTRSETLPTWRYFIIILTPSYHDTPSLILNVWQSVFTKKTGGRPDTIVIIIEALNNYVGDVTFGPRAIHFSMRLIDK
jgi:hypothetical protein